MSSLLKLLKSLVFLVGVVCFSHQAQGIKLDEAKKSIHKLSASITAYQEDPSPENKIKCDIAMTRLSVAASYVADGSIKGVDSDADKAGKQIQAFQIASIGAMMSYRRQFPTALQRKFDDLLAYSKGNGRRGVNGVSAAVLRRNLRWIAEGLRAPPGGERRRAIALRISQAPNTRAAYLLLNLQNEAYDGLRSLMKRLTNSSEPGEKLWGAFKLYDVTQDQIVINASLVAATEGLE